MKLHFATSSGKVNALHQGEGEFDRRGKAQHQGSRYVGDSEDGQRVRSLSRSTKRTVARGTEAQRTVDRPRMDDQCSCRWRSNAPHAESDFYSAQDSGGVGTCSTRARDLAEGTSSRRGSESNTSTNGESGKCHVRFGTPGPTLRIRRASLAVGLTGDPPDRIDSLGAVLT